MKNFKASLSLSLIGFVFCSCSPLASLTGRDEVYTFSKPRQQVTQVSRVADAEESADPYCLRPTPIGARKGPRFMHVRTTAYSHQENEKGGIYGRKNAYGSNLRYGSLIRSAAADWSRYPLGTQFKIIGEPHIYVVDDYGSALVGTDTIDIYKPNLSMMRAWGVRHIDIEIVKWGCYESSFTLIDGRKHVAPHCWQMYKCLKPKVGPRA